MKRQVIFTLVLSGLSFGVIDSAVTKDKSTNQTELIDLQKEREEELCKIEEEKYLLELHHEE